MVSVGLWSIGDRCVREKAAHGWRNQDQTLMGKQADTNKYGGPLRALGDLVLFNL